MPKVHESRKHDSEEEKSIIWRRKAKCVVCELGKLDSRKKNLLW